MPLLKWVIEVENHHYCYKKIGEHLLKAPKQTPITPYFYELEKRRKTKVCV